MRVLIKFAVNTATWSNKEVAEFLKEVIKPKDADTKIWRLKIDQINSIKDKLGSEPKMPASFKEIYQQFKSAKLKSEESDKDFPKSLGKTRSGFSHGELKGTVKVGDKVFGVYEDGDGIQMAMTDYDGDKFNKSYYVHGDLKSVEKELKEKFDKADKAKSEKPDSKGASALEKCIKRAKAKRVSPIYPINDGSGVACVVEYKEDGAGMIYRVWYINSSRGKWNNFNGYTASAYNHTPEGLKSAEEEILYSLQ